MARSSVAIIPDTKTTDTEDSDSIIFDAVTVFSISKGRSISKSPTTSGNFISEILSENGGKVTMEAYVSANPVFISANNLISSTDPETRTYAAYETLDAMYNSKSTVTIVHRFAALPSYFLTNFSPIIMPDDSIGFRLEFEEVRFVDEIRVQLITNMSDEKIKGASDSVNGGLVNHQDPSGNDTTSLQRAFSTTIDFGKSIVDTLNPF